MAIYAIGDVQGCYDELRRLLERIEFDPTRDRLWFAGDLVNRGPQSLEVLRYVKSLGDRAVTVLGNHDLHLLALSQGNQRHYRHGSLEAILQAPDRHDLLDWLRHRPLMYHHEKRGYCLLHAGLPPQWDIPTALRLARELETTLQGTGFHAFCHGMYGNEPSRWSEGLRGMDRLRFITNCFTRLRFCDAEGRIKLKHKGPPGSQRKGRIPWFEHPQRATSGQRIVFGHWSTLGYVARHNAWALDTGCLWGGALTLLRLDQSRPAPQSVPCARWQDPANFA